jgi:diaminopimelate decarboxylase
MIQTEIAGVAIPVLAQQFGTPVYVYDEATIRARVAELAGFPVIRYAQKANSNLAILSLMRELGVKVDAVSLGEMHRALTVGYTPSEIVYTADVFTHESLEFIATHQIPVNAGSADMIRQFAARVPGGNLTVRINPGFGHGHSKKTNTGGPQSKHGIWHEQLPDCVTLAKSLGVTITGVHMHIGSGCDFEHLSQVGQALLAAAATLGDDLRMVSAGGGLPTPYRPTDARIDLTRFTHHWQALHRQLEQQMGRAVELEVEPGRYLVAEAGYLVAELRAIKHQGPMPFYLLDAGFHNLARPVMYGAYHGMTICPASGDPEPRPLREVVVGGPLCESGDIFTQQEGGVVETRSLPEASVGDYLVFHGAGAYGFAMSSNYNSFPLLAEVLIRDGQPRLIRRRQTPADLIRQEVDLA